MDTLEIVLVQHQSQYRAQVALLLVQLQDRAPPHDSYDHGHYRSQDSGLAYNLENLGLYKNVEKCH